MAKAQGVKLGYGKAEDVNEAIAQGKIDPRDFIIATDTHEFKYVDDEKNVQDVVIRIKRYADVESAIIGINEASYTYQGQTIMIYDASSNRYVPYTVQIDPTDNTKFTVEKVLTIYDGKPGVRWVEF